MKQYKFLFTDLDGTLIKTISGKTFPKDATDFQLRKEVLDKIKLMPGLLGIFIVTNQGGIPQYVSLSKTFRLSFTPLSCSLPVTAVTLPFAATVLLLTKRIQCASLTLVCWRT